MAALQVMPMHVSAGKLRECPSNSADKQSPGIKLNSLRFLLAGNERHNLAKHWQAAMLRKAARLEMQCRVALERLAYRYRQP